MNVRSGTKAHASVSSVSQAMRYSETSAAYSLLMSLCFLLRGDASSQRIELAKKQ